MRGIRNVLLISTLLLGVTVLVVAMFPASTALGWLAGRLGPLRLAGIGGTIWHGFAQEASVLGEPIGRLHWSIEPFSLLLAQPQVALRLEGDRYQGRTQVRWGQTLEFTDTWLSLPAQRLQPALDIPGLVPQGVVELELPTARIEHWMPVAVQGRARWRDAVVVGPDTVRLGDVEVEFSGQGGGMSGAIKDRGGPLRIAGRFEFGLRGYTVEVELDPRTEDPALRRVLERVGEARADGGRLLRITGTLLPLR